MRQRPFFDHTAKARLSAGIIFKEEEDEVVSTKGTLKILCSHPPQIPPN